MSAAWTCTKCGKRTCYGHSGQKRKSLQLCSSCWLEADGEERERRAAIRRNKDAQKKAIGQCVACGDVAVSGSTFCAFHRDRSRKLLRDLRRARHAAGLCLKCGRPPVVGRRQCDRCTRESRKRQRTWKGSRKALHDGRLALGVCVLCGDPVAPGSVKCEFHLSRHREVVRRHDAKQRALGLCAKCSNPVANVGTGCYCRKHLEWDSKRRQNRIKEKVVLQRVELVKAAKEARARSGDLQGLTDQELDELFGEEDDHTACRRNSATLFVRGCSLVEV